MQGQPSPNAIRHLLACIYRAETADEAFHRLLSESRERVVVRALEEHAVRFRRQLLVDLANLHADGVAHFRRRFDGQSWRSSDRAILELREQLLRLWDPEQA